ncbi:ABC transporter permease subunit [Tessaracoccus coleopterorum]|uniref:ABC transporter permease subunit n=1 Tax=Tessaracoccus coleopterorum TaxID=2714950 RepID=UPI0018D43677|nr:ABC transporter permease subunit [Tessaracoccus coleopterorum]
MFEDPPLWVVAGVLGLVGWAWGARVLRAQTMSLRNRDFVLAARANGEPLRRIITIEMLPNLMALIAASFVGTVTAAILSLTTLSYIGVIPVTTYNWGRSSTGHPRRARSSRTSGGGTCPRPLHRRHRRRPVPHQLRHRRVRQSAPAVRR